MRCAPPADATMREGLARREKAARSEQFVRLNRRSHVATQRTDSRNGQQRSSRSENDACAARNRRVVGEARRFDGTRRARGLRGADVQAVGPSEPECPADRNRSEEARARAMRVQLVSPADSVAATLAPRARLDRGSETRPRRACSSGPFRPQRRTCSNLAPGPAQRRRLQWIVICPVVSVSLARS